MRLMLVGDLMLGRGVDQLFAHRCPPQLQEAFVRDARDYLRLAEDLNGRIPRPVPAGWLWGDALAALARFAPDLRIANLETAVTDAGTPWPGKGIHYRMHPANLAVLRAARIDACALANNHAMDWGRDALHDTLGALAAAGVAVAGAGESLAAARAPAILPAGDGGRVLLFSCATPDSGVPPAWAARADRAGVDLLSGLSPAAADAIAARVSRQRRPGDRVIVSIHWGGNWGAQVPPAHRDFARRLVDAGAADVVHGHSSHAPLPLEVHRGRLILYGCGDLVNDYEGIPMAVDQRADLGCLYLATLAADGALADLQIVPLRRHRLRLEAADAVARAWLAPRFERSPPAAGRRLVATDDGRWRLVHDDDA